MLNGRLRRFAPLGTVLLVLLLLVSACGGSGGSQSSGAPLSSPGASGSSGSSSGGSPGNSAATAAAQPDDAKLYEEAKKEGTVVWYGSAPLDAMKPIAADFEKKYPGVKVEVLRIVGVQQYQRFLQETEAKKHMADVLFISDFPSMKDLIQQGHIVEWKVPTADRIPEAFRIGYYSYSPYATDIAIVYNVNKLTPEEVKILDSGWKGVLDPRFKGRFAASSHKCGACYAGVHMFLDPKFKSEYGEEFLKKIGEQKPAVYSEVLVGLDRVIAGEHDFTYWTWEAIAYTKFKEGAPIRWLHPDPTPEWGNAWHAVSKYAPHPNAARLFMNWMMGEEGALSIQKNYGPRTVLEGVQDIRTMSKEPWYDPIKVRYEVDWERWGKNYDQDMDLYSKYIGKGK